MTLRHLLFLIGTWTATLAVDLGTLAVVANELALPSSRPTRWLEVRTLTGDVEFTPAQATTQPAQQGDRLSAVGDELRTQRQSEAGLAFDDAIGYVSVSEDTILRVRQLDIGENGGRITRLVLPKGIARLQIRRFTNPETEITIKSPAGIAGVRGTEFGVGVTPTGRTSVATLEGTVEATAQGESVQIEAGRFSIVIPGQPPSPPGQLDDTHLRLGVNSLTYVANGRQVRFVGRIHPVNTVYINRRILDTDEQGRFDEIVAIDDRQSLRVAVRSPLGNQRRYLLVGDANGFTRHFLSDDED